MLARRSTAKLLYLYGNFCSVARLRISLPLRSSDLRAVFFFYWEEEVVLFLDRGKAGSGAYDENTGPDRGGAIIHVCEN